MIDTITAPVPISTEQAQASILEFFVSRQGEGICVGDPHFFIRFGGCNLICDYCDTPESIPAKSGAIAGLDDVLQQAKAARAQLARPIVSLTGGEPLAQVGFLKKLLPHLRQQGWQVYLETNGSLPAALEKVVDDCDWIAMDFKPESATGRHLWEAHQWFLKMGGSKIFVKLVLTHKTQEAELLQAIALVESVSPAIPFVLQPASSWGEVRSIPLATLVSWWGTAVRRLADVRIIPQVHRLWDIP